MSGEHEIIIIGGGPAGLSAGIYTARDRRDTLLIEKGVVGGLITMTEHVENYPAFPDGISGMKLGELMHQQATKFGLKTIYAEVASVELKEKQKVVKTTDGEFTCKALIIAGGSEISKLGVPGEAEFTGRGVSYCATCDGAFFRDVPVAVIGGGNVAISEALHMTRFASRVFVIHRRDQLRADRILQERAFSEPKIELVWNTVVDAVEGKDVVGSLKLQNVKTRGKSKLAVAGVFVAVGFKPNTDYLKGVLPLDDAGCIIVNERLETKIAGVFAAGDIRCNSARQVIAAAGDGASAAINAAKYIEE